MATYVTWKLNGTLLHELGLKEGRLTYANLQPDTLELRHLTARWDADPLFDYGDAVRLDKVEINAATGDVVATECVFRGKAREFPRFFGRDAESLSYVFAGPWDELKRRPLLQNQAVVVDPLVSEIPTMVPQGLVILAQDDGGETVSLAQALEVCIEAAQDAGVSIALGDVDGFDFDVAWDELADLTIADAIVRLLQVAPDAVAWIDYAPETPVIHFGRRGNLDAVDLPVVLEEEAEGFPVAAALESLRIRARPDLQVPFVGLHYRRTNTVNGKSYIVVEKREAGPGSETDENALIRTVQLAGTSYSETILTQEVRTLPLSAALGTAVLDATVVTATSNPTAFLALSNFWKRKVPALASPDVVIKGFKNRRRLAASVADATGAETTPALDTALTSELIEGAVTPWMNRVAQEQNYEARIAYSVAGVDQQDSGGYGIAHVAGVQATNAATRTYSFRESSDFTPAEPTPEGLETSLYAALSPLQHEGGLTILEQECRLGIRPGLVLNLTGGRAEWETMRGVIQNVVATLDDWRTEVSFGFPEALGPSDLVEIYRANRNKRPAERGLSRETGLL